MQIAFNDLGDQGLNHPVDGTRPPTADARRHALLEDTSAVARKTSDPMVDGLACAPQALGHRRWTFSIGQPQYHLSPAQDLGMRGRRQELFQWA